MKEVDLLNMQRIKVILNSIYPLLGRCYFIPEWANSLKMLPMFIIICYNKSPDEAKQLFCFLKAIILRDCVAVYQLPCVHYSLFLSLVSYSACINEISNFKKSLQQEV